MGCIKIRKKKNMNRLIITLIFAVSAILLNGQNILGTWKTIDDEENVEKSHIQLYEEDGILYGKVVKLLEGATATHCSNCEGDKKDASITGMIVMYDMKKDGAAYDEGTILDPATGKEYSCKIELEEADKLKVRGYIGYSWLGRTQYWYRVQ